MYCYVRDCPNGLKSLKRKKDSDLVKFFSAPEDKNILEKWRRVVPKGENVLTPEDKLCDSHFLPSEVLWFTETKLSNGNVRRLLRDEPILRPGTIPSIFPAEKLEKENAILPGKEKQETPKPIVKSITSVVKEKSASSKSIVRNTNTVVNVKNETPKSNVRIRFKDPAESSGKRNPQRVKRRSTILDDYWTDDELNQVHNPGVSKTPSGSAKKRKTESSGLQPVIRLVPLECLMDKTVSKSKTPSKPIVANRPSTEEIDHELKKVIEIPLLTRLKPSKSMTIRSTKETVQFKPSRRNLSKTKMKILPLSETLVSHDVVTVSPSEGFNEVKTETPDTPLGEDDSVVVKSEEEDDGYSINEVTENPIFTVGDEVPTIKSESEEEQPAVEVGSYNTSDNELAVKSHSVEAAAESEAAAGSEQGPALPTENSDNILTPHEQPNNVPEVPAEIEQNKNVEEHSANETEVVEKNAAVEAVDDTSCNKGTEEGEVSKSSEEKSHEEEVLENKEKEETAESAKEDEAEIPTNAASKEVNTDSQEMESERKSVESAMETEASIEVEPKRQEGENVMEIEKETLLSENIEHITKPAENEEMSKLVEREEMPKPLESEEMPKPVESEEMPKPVESDEMPKPVESDEMSKPVESEEMSKPVECEGMSKPVESEEMPKPAESNEMPKPVEREEMPKTVESDEILKAVESEEMPNPIESEVSQG
ncbi:unnamed protein product [Nezara viridula]|uniref:THAP-type domain-containing protein n=1 Tax=Nezara viridula TaxID=85310 RepID=A0A9P0H3T2_NEZVI|nr:unnamed protein product [Nezara viridula]